MNENEFGYRVRQALNEATERLDYTTTYRWKGPAAALARQPAGAVWLPRCRRGGRPARRARLARASAW
jgi:hypothetical protein